MGDINYRLICAVRKGNLEETRKVIKSYGLSYSPAWSDGYNLLLDALENNRSAVAKLLLTSGAKIKSKKSNFSDTLLQLAVENGDVEIITMLLDRGAYIDAKTYDGKTSLHNAIQNKKTEVVEQLLNYGASVNCVCTTRRGNGNTPLHLAVESGSKEFTTLLLSKGANVDAKNEDSFTPLHIAAEKRHIQIAEELLNHGASMHSLTSKGYTPLHFASEGGNEENVELFLNKGADVNASTMDNLTPILLATKKGHEAIVKLLLQHGAEVDHRDKDGNTTLYLAVEKGHEAIVKLLLQHGAKVDHRNKDGNTILYPAVEKGHKLIVKLLLQNGAKVDHHDKGGKTILYLAVENGYLEIVENVLKYCPDINIQSNRSCLKIAVYGPSYRKDYKKITEALLEYGFTVEPEDANDPNLLHVAVEKGYFKIVEDLLKNGADVNALHNLHIAAKNKQEEVAKLLIIHGADINARDDTGETPIMYAIKEQCIEIVKALLQQDIDINASDQYGKTALHYTALSGNLGIPDRGEIAKLLLSKGANVDAKTAKGVTTLVEAVLRGYVNVVEAVLEYNANVNPEVKIVEKGMTLLHISAEKGNKEICTMLLNKGVNVNAKTEKGNTALHFATKKGSEEIVKLLLDRGATVDSQNVSGLTPLHIASLEGHGIAVETLLDYDADINISCRNNFTPLTFAISRERKFYKQEPEIHCEYYEVRNPFELTVETLKCHLMKMRTANLYVSERNLLSMASSYDIHDFETDCKEEIEIMKRVKIVNSSISFYDVLSKATSSLAIFMKNENIVHVLEAEDYESEFPIYASMIRCHFKRAMERKKLFEPANKISRFLFNSFPELTCECIEKIFSFLSNKELRILIDTCEFLSGSNSKSNVEEEVITSTLSQVQLV